jgi:hypothetical protein
VIRRSLPRTSFSNACSRTAIATSAWPGRSRRRRLVDRAYSVNNLTTARNDDDGSVTSRFGGDESLPNQLPIVEGWNYTVRLYRPRKEILDGTWEFPAINQS